MSVVAPLFDRVAFVFSRTLVACSEAMCDAPIRPLAAVVSRTADVASLARWLLPGVRCDARACCCARGGYAVARYEGDAGGGWSLCRLHAEAFVREHEDRGEYGKVVRHVCDDNCEHGALVRW